MIYALFRSIMLQFYKLRHFIIALTCKDYRTGHRCNKYKQTSDCRTRVFCPAWDFYRARDLYRICAYWRCPKMKKCRWSEAEEGASRYE